MPRTKVFLTWSGQRSNGVATALRKWLPRVIQNLDPWMSETDMDKGTQWSSEISVQLRQSRIGIICLTPENLGEPWINFEAGALSRLEGSYACTYLYDLATQSIQFPLAQFQSTKAEKEDTRKLVQTINKAINEEALPVEQLNEAFEKWWPDLSTALSQITQTPSEAQPPRRSTEEVLEEIVSTIRENSHAQSTILNEVRLVRNGLEADAEQAFRWNPQTSQSVRNAFAYRFERHRGGGFVTPQTGSLGLEGETPLVLKMSTQNVQAEDKEPGK